MRIVAQTLDDLCRKAYRALLKGAQPTNPSRDPAHERTGVLLELRNPRARLSRTETRGKVFSCLGELLWYLSRDNRLEFITYYIKEYEKESQDGETIYGGYGRRLFAHSSHNQVRTLIETLRHKDRSDTRRAVLQIFEAADTEGNHTPSRRREVPCTLALQFLLRSGRLGLYATMRSQDAYKGLPHDIFCFTMLQEIIARSVGAELGEYKQFVGSLHLYDKDRPLAEQYVAEDVQQTIPMPPMPHGDPWPAIAVLLDAEAQIRAGLPPARATASLSPYWMDLVRLLQIFAGGDQARHRRLRSAMAFTGFNVYIDGRNNAKPRPPQPPRQPLLPF